MTQPKASTEAPPSLWEDLLEIFYAPRAVFERRRETPAFGLALVVFFVLFVLLMLVFKDLMQPIFDLEFRRGMAEAMRQNPSLTPEQMETGRAFASKFMVVGIGGYALVAPLIMGLVLWAAGKLVDSAAQIGQTMMVATYAMYPRVLEGILNAVQMLVVPEESIKGRYSLSLGVARFLDPETTSPLLLGLLGRVDLFTLWVTALMVIGVAVMGRVPVGRAVVVGVVAWLVGALPTLWGALRAGG